MGKLKIWTDVLLMKGGAFLAALAMIAATFAANSACMFPYYEPEQPEELEILKRNKH